MAGTSVAQLSELLGSESAPLVIDVRRREAFLKDIKTIGGALRWDPERISSWFVHNDGPSSHLAPT